MLVKLKRKEKQKKNIYNPNKESKYSKVYKIDKRKLRKKLVEKINKTKLSTRRNVNLPFFCFIITLAEVAENGQGMAIEKEKEGIKVHVRCAVKKK